MKIAIASDHAGFPLKEAVREFVGMLGHDVRDPSAAGTALNL
jgi:ribose 5-phosphate isomerase B